MTEFQFYKELDPGVKSQKKGIYELRKMVISQAQD